MLPDNRQVLLQPYFLVCLLSPTNQDLINYVQYSDTQNVNRHKEIKKVDMVNTQTFQNH